MWDWTVKKAERRRIDAFELWCWRRLLRVPWTARRSDQPILKEISPGISLEGMMLKLKLQYFGHLMQSWLTGKDSDTGRDWGQEEKGITEDEMVGWHHWLDGLESEWTPGVGDGQGGLVCCDSWGRKESDTTERLIWSDLIWMSHVLAVKTNTESLVWFHPLRTTSRHLKANGLEQNHSTWDRQRINTYPWYEFSFSTDRAIHDLTECMI